MGDYAVVALEKKGNGVYSIVNKDSIDTANYIETTYLCETYDNYGNKVGCYDAGCYSFDNSDSGMHEDCIKEINEKFNLNLDYETWMCDIDDWKEYLESDVPEDKIGKILEFIEEFEKENAQHIEVKAVTYWNGHNWQSIVLEHDEDGYTDGYILDEEEATDILAAWEKIGCSVGYIPKVSKSVFTIHKGVGYLFSDDRYPGWQLADCEVIEPSKIVSVQIEENDVEVAPYWIDDLSFFFEYEGEIYFAKGFYTPDGKLVYDTVKTNTLD